VRIAFFTVSSGGKRGEVSGRKERKDGKPKCFLLPIGPGRGRRKRGGVPKYGAGRRERVL